MSIAQLRQGGLGLPDRDYYLDEDKAETRGKYVDHVARMLKFVSPESTDEVLNKAATEVPPSPWPLTGLNVP
jgi:putative endopeptidase